MRKLWLYLFYALCAFTIVFSLFWMALPKLSFPTPSVSGEETPIESQLSLSAQGIPTLDHTAYYLCDEGGRVTVYRCLPDGTPDDLLERTDIYVNLLPEGDALRLKHGLTVPSESELRQLLEDLGE